MHRALVACVPVLLVLTACVHDSNTSRPSAAAAPTPAAAPRATTTTPDMPAPVPSAPAPPAEAPNAVPSAAPAAGAPTGEEAAAAGAATAAPAVRSGSTSSKPAKAPAAAASGAPPAAAGSAVPATPAAAPPPPAASTAALDLNGLEQRLRDNRAIGVFTKLTLKNQVDDLLGKFKSFHQGQSRVTLAQLRQQYEVLLLKVISLLQDDDPSLASAVSSSRETIWGVLTDPKKFANI
jgi:hypothetical protein